MALVANSAFLKISLGWEQDIAGEAPFADATQSDALSIRGAVANTITEVLVDTFTLAANATQDVDFYSYLNQWSNVTKTFTKAQGFVVRARGPVGGQLRMAKAAANALAWFWGGTTPSITLNTAGNTVDAGIGLWDGSPATVGNTTRNITFSNPGNATITVSIGALTG